MQTFKRYVVSSLHTFLTGFLIGIVPVLNNLTIHDVSLGTLKATALGLVAVGVRAGIKALYEFALTKLAPQA